MDKQEAKTMQMTKLTDQGLPNTSDGVGVEYPVSTNDGQLLKNRLSNNHPVKWVTMMVRQIGQYGGVLRLNRENGEFIVANSLSDYPE